jgi:subtilisin family serine protease
MVKRIFHSFLAVMVVVGTFVPSVYANSESQQNFNLSDLLENEFTRSDQQQITSQQTVQLGQVGANPPTQHVQEAKEYDEVIIQFKSTATNEQKTKTIKEFQGDMIAEWDGASLVKLPASTRWQDIKESLNSNEYVQFAEPNVVLKTQASPPNDPDYPSQWALTAIEAEKAWDTVNNLTYGAVPPVEPTPIVVAVIDSGVDHSHPDLTGRLLPGFNTITGANESDYTDSTGHGTHVAGVIAAVSNNELGVSGAAGVFPVKLLPIKAFDESSQGTTFDIANAIKRASEWVGPNGEKVKVMNLSFGFRDWQYGENFSLVNAIMNAQSQGIVIVAAAGDDGIPIEGGNDGPPAFYPAHFGGVISVGAVDENFEIRGNSNPGATIVAPGGNIQSTLPNGTYGTDSGTSVATPFVSASVALQLMVNPQLTTEQIKHSIVSGLIENNWSMHRSLLASLPGSDSNPPLWPEGSILSANAEVDQVSLQWSQASGESGDISYVVYQDGVALPGNQESPYQITGLSPDTEYTFKVEAVDIWGNQSTNGPSITVQTNSVGEAFEKITSAQGGGLTNGDSIFGSSSENGRYVVYSSKATNLVEGDTNGFSDIFVFDRQTNETKRISLSQDGEQANGDNFAPIISMDGDYILFTSKASNLTKETDSNSNIEDLFLYHHNSGAIEKVADDVSAISVYTYLRSDRAYAMSANGRYIVYASDSNNGDKSDSNGTWDVSIKDRWNQSTKRLTDRLSTNRDNLPTGVAMTPDGRYVAYTTEDSKNILNAYLYDSHTRVTEELSVEIGEEQTYMDSYSPTISADGRYVAFTSYSNQLVPNDESWNLDVFVRDRQEQKTEIISKTITGEPSDDYNEAPWISADGRYVVFHSYDDLDPRADRTIQVYIHDRNTDKTELLSKSPFGYPGSSDSWIPFITQNGRYVVFESYANNLSNPDHDDHFSDIYFKQLNTNQLPEAKWDESAELVATQIGANYVHITWHDDSHTGKNLYYKVTSGDQLLDIVQGNSYLVKNLTPAASYNLSVQVGDESFNWSENLSLEVTTLPTRETTAPAAIVDPVLLPSFGKLSITWKDPTDQDYIGAKIHWRKIGNSTFRETKVIGKGVEETELIGLINSSLYEIVFVSIDADGNETESPVFSVRTPTGPQTARISISNDYVEADSSSGEILDVSDDGRYIVFSSTATNLVGNTPDNYLTDIFLYDRMTESIQLISKTIDGHPANNNSFNPQISGNGRFIVYHSFAKNLTSTDDTDHYGDIFLYDRDSDEDGKFDEPNGTSTKEITSKGTSGHSTSASINHDGSVITFESSASNLVPEDTWETDVYVYHTNLDKISKLELEDGTVPNKNSNGPKISGNGDYIVFMTDGDNLDANDVNDRTDVYLYQISTKKMKRVSAFPDEGVRNTEAFWPSISDDGRYIAYHYRNYSKENNYLVYLHDRDNEDPVTANQLISVTPTGNAAGGSVFPSVSGDGRYVAFESSSNLLVTNDENNSEDIFLYDRTNGSIRLVSESYNGTEAAGGSQIPAINGDGSIIGYSSYSDQLVSDDFNSWNDIFVTTILEPTVPSWPSGSKLSVIDKGETYVTLSWTPANDQQGISSYKIYYGDSLSKTVSGMTTSVKIDGLEPGKRYTFTVQAGNTFDLWTEDGPTIEVTTLEETNLADLTLEAQGNARIKLTWEKANPNLQITGFEIYRRSGEEPAELVGTVSDPAVNTYTDQVDYVTEYTYYVMSVDSSGEKKRYTLEKSITSTGITMNSVRYTTPLSFNRYALIGESLSIVAVGDKGVTVNGVIQYETTDGLQQEAQVNLTETVPGNYVGSLQIPDKAAQIKSITAIASKNGVETQITGSQNLLFVGANLTMDVTTEAGDLPQGSYLSLSSPSKKIYTGLELNGSGSYTLTGLPASGDYQYQITSPNGIKLEILDKKAISTKYGEAVTHDVQVRILASLRGKITFKDESIKSDAHVIITQEGRHLLSRTITINSHQEFTVPGLKTGDELKIEVRPFEANLGHFLQTVVLQPGENSVNIELLPRKSATLTGQVTDQAGEPVSKITVHAQQWVGNKQVSKETVTDENGRYSFDLMEGSATVYAFIPQVASTNYVDVLLENGKDHSANLAFSTPLPGLLELDIFTKHKGGEWTKLDLDWRVLVHFRFNISHPRRDDNRGGLLSVYTDPGDVVKVCIDGVESNLPKTCGETTMNPSNRGKLELRLEQTGSQVKAMLEGSPSWPSYRAKLYSVDDQGKRTSVSEKTYGPELLLDIHQPGKYQLELSAYGHMAYREFEMAAGEVKDLGTIKLLGPGIYGGKPGNIVLTSPSEVLPGGLVQVRNHYSNSSTKETTDTELILEIPAGTSFVENSILINGKQVDATKVENNKFAVSVGAVPSKGSGVVTYHLRLEKEYSQSNVSVMQNIHFIHNGLAVEERLGGAFVEVTRMKLEAPSVTGRKDLTVSGIAPAGSKVNVFDQDLFLGQTIANPNGTWKQTIRLTNSDKTSQHSLRAVAFMGEESWQSEIVPVTYEHDHPEIVNVQMSQGGERSVSFDPGQGIAVFPYVYVPGHSFNVSLNFQDDSRVSDVKVHIGNAKSSMGRGANGSYSAIVSPSKPGAIYVSYNVRKSVSIGEIPSQEDYESQVPGFEQFEVESNKVTQSDTDPYQLNTATQGTMNIKGHQIGIGVNTSFQSVEYSSSPVDDNWTSKTGLSVHGFSFSYSISDDTLSYTISAYIPESEFQSAGAANVIKTLINGKAEGTKTNTVVAAKVGRYIKVAYNGYMKYVNEHFNLWDAFETYKDISDQVESKDTLDELEKLIDLAALNCDPETARQYIDRANNIANKFMAQEVVKWAMTIGAAVAGPASFGVGTILLFGASELIEAVMDRAIELQIEKLKKDISEDEKCEKEEEDRKKVADPIWIYDPSGFVYEVDESNRLEGVTATAMFWDEMEKSWKQWDAEWYGQINPQVTGRDGKYAWDVPEGKWKVVFSKDGFVTAESDELTVLPPHTDVNIGMTSLLPPGKMEIIAAPGGHSIDLVFDRHVMVDAINDATISVWKLGQGEMVELAEVSAVDAVLFNQKQVAKRFRLTFTKTLEVGEEYKVKASQGILSYNDIPLRVDLVKNVVIPERDLAPAKVSNVTTFAGIQEISVNWLDPEDLDLDHLIVSWEKEGHQEHSNTVKVSKGVGSALLTDLTSSTDYDIRVEAVDEAGNISEVKLSVSTLAAEPEIDLVAPNPVTNALVKAEGANLKVTWNDPESDDFDKVVIRWKESEREQDYTSALVPKGLEAYVLTGLKSNTSYDILVVSMDIAGNESDGWFTSVKTAVNNHPGPVIPPVDPPPGGGGGDPKPEDPKDPPNPPEPDVNKTTVFVTEKGGSFKVFEQKLAFNIQPKTFDKEVKLLIEKNASPLTLPSEKYRKMSAAYSILEEGKNGLLKPMTIAIQYDAALLQNIDPRKLGIYRQDDVDHRKWIYVGGVVDTTKQQIYTNVEQWGNYAILVYEHQFADMQNNWSKPEVELLVSRHFVSGVTPDAFKPNQTITRAQFTKLIVNFANASGINYPEHKAITFTDVTKDAWYKDYLDQAVKLGLVKGSEGKFMPNAPITREQMVTMIYRALQVDTSNLADIKLLEPYKDHNKVGDWAQTPFAYAIKHEIIKGNPELQLKPKDFTTRAQAAVVFVRLLNHVEMLTGKSPF